MLFDAPPPPLWTPPKPAIIRAAEPALIKCGLFVPPVFIPPAGVESHHLIDILTNLGLTSGLELCLDPSDPDSYTSGQTWADQSGNDYDFFLGANGSATSTDPTFNGSAGDADAYWSFDGGDYFSGSVSNPTWVENIHKDNAIFTMATWFHAPSDNFSFAGTASNSSGTVGFRWFCSVDQAIIFNQQNGSAFNPMSSAATFSLNAWEFAAVSVNEATGAGIFAVNGTTETFSSTYSSPSASSALSTLLLASRGGPGAFFPNTSRMGSFLAWSSALSEAELLSIYEATRGRYGV